MCCTGSSLSMVRDPQHTCTRITCLQCYCPVVFLVFDCLLEVPYLYSAALELAPEPCCLVLLCLHAVSRTSYFRRAVAVVSGTVTSCIVMKEPGTLKSRGFGFVNFSTHESAEAAIAALNGLAVPSEAAEEPAAVAADGAPEAPKEVSFAGSVY